MKERERIGDLVESQSGVWTIKRIPGRRLPPVKPFHHTTTGAVSHRLSSALSFTLFSLLGQLNCQSVSWSGPLCLTLTQFGLFYCTVTTCTTSLPLICDKKTEREREKDREREMGERAQKWHSISSNPFPCVCESFHYDSATHREAYYLLDAYRVCVCVTFLRDFICYAFCSSVRLTLTSRGLLDPFTAKVCRDFIFKHMLVRTQHIPKMLTANIRWCCWMALILHSGINIPVRNTDWSPMKHGGLRVFVQITKPLHQICLRANFLSPYKILGMLTLMEMKWAEDKEICYQSHLSSS